MIGPKGKEHPWRRKRRRLLLAMGVFFGVAVLGLAALGMLANWTLQREIDAIRAKGEPVTPGELSQRFPAPLQKDNAAETFGKAGDSLKAVLFDKEYRARQEQITMTAPQSRFAEELHAWMEDCLAEHAETLHVLREAAKNPDIRYDLDLYKGLSAPIPDFLQLADLARLLQLEAFVAAEDGDSGRATEAIVAALAMDRPMREAPILIMQRFRQTLRSMACATIRRVLTMAAFSDQQLARLQVALAETNDPETLTNALIGERASGLAMFNQPAGSLANGLVFTIMTVRGDGERYFRYMSEAIDASRRPVPEALDIMERIGGELSSRSWFIVGLPEIVIPNLLRIEAQAASDDAFMLAAQSAVALERFRNSNGHPPERIQELAPALLSAVPLDPFDSQPLRYRSDDRGYTFYSIGENRVDDGGEEGPGSNLDVVFQVTYPR